MGRGPEDYFGCLVCLGIEQQNSWSQALQKAHKLQIVVDQKGHRRWAGWFCLKLEQPRPFCFSFGQPLDVDDLQPNRWKCRKIIHISCLSEWLLWIVFLYAYQFHLQNLVFTRSFCCRNMVDFSYLSLAIFLISKDLSLY